ncbi:CheR family methyltransferase [Novosphingobium lentum]|uniref:CheR family methyltransferase n=1 Tax=Novosphingobium lentum TaxID=145287 RepID=UPI0008324244|nr:protein-glutamate O-methyltransferase CheR [Novosphingobium lentum]
MNLGAALSQPIPGISPDVYGEADFHAIAEIVYAGSGNVLPKGKAMLVYSRIAPLVRESGCGTFGNYVALIRRDPEQQARAVAALTTNHTFFYREAHHFDFFDQEVRPSIVKKLAAGRPARLWSAGCSSGEETWSLVMALLGADKSEGARIARGDIRVLATDLAPHALTKAKAAQYEAKDLQPMPSDFVRHWTQTEGNTTAIGEVARSLVRFRSLNLLHDWPMHGKFDAIFCRNVMIYFDNETKERLVARFADMLFPGSHLFIGHSERVTGPAARVLEPVGPTIYRKRMS